MPALQEGLYDLGRLDQLAYADSPIHRIDPRAKVVATLVFLVCVVSFGKYEVLAMLPFAAFPLFLAADAGLPLSFLLKKTLAVLPFAFLVGMFNPLLDRDLITLAVGIDVAGGWVSFASILLRFMLTATVALVLIATTGLPGICAALQRLGMPDVLAVQLLLLYRYIFVLGEEVMRMARARALRSFGQRGMGLGTYAGMLGSLLLRTYARAERIHRAMLSRGFDGTVRIVRTLQLTGRDVVFAAGWSFAFVAMRVLNLPVLLGRLVTGWV